MVYKLFDDKKKRKKEDKRKREKRERKRRDIKRVKVNWLAWKEKTRKIV